MVYKKKEGLAFQDFINWVFYAGIAYIGSDMTTNIKNVTQSVTLLNTQAAVIVEQLRSQKEVNSDQREINQRMSDRLRVLENKGNKE